MPGKDELVAMLDRSARVVEVELALLDDWRTDPATTAGRRAQMDLTVNYIGVGMSCARRVTAHALADAMALAETSVAHPPGPQHEAAVQATADSVTTRASWPVPTLTDAGFAAAMLNARSNADMAAENSEAIFADCTRPDAPPPPALAKVAEPIAAMVAALPAARGHKRERR